MIFKYKDYSFIIPDNNIDAKSSKKPESIGQRMQLGQWEESEASLLESYLEPGDRVVELGACIGFLGVLVNRSITNKKDHVLIEANPDLIPVIEENKKMNECEFKIEHCLIGDPKDKFMDFNISNFILGSSVYGKGERTVKVPVKSISEYSRKYNFLIVDIEGGEYELIKRNLAHLARFDKILIEFHPFFGFTEADVQKGINSLKKVGFSIIKRSGHVYMMKK
jgi:FkbM family methyltransferase